MSLKLCGSPPCVGVHKRQPRMRKHTTGNAQMCNEQDGEPTKEPHSGEASLLTSQAIFVPNVIGTHASRVGTKPQSASESRSGGQHRAEARACQRKRNKLNTTTKHLEHDFPDVFPLKVCVSSNQALFTEVETSITLAVRNTRHTPCHPPSDIDQERAGGQHECRSTGALPERRRARLRF